MEEETKIKTREIKGRELKTSSGATILCGLIDDSVYLEFKKDGTAIPLTLSKEAANLLLALLIECRGEFS